MRISPSQRQSTPITTLSQIKGSQLPKPSASQSQVISGPHWPCTSPNASPASPSRRPRSYTTLNFIYFPSSQIYYTINYVFLIFIFERECAHMHEQGRGRGRERESQAGFMLGSEPNNGLDPMTLGSWPELKSRAGCSTDCASEALLSHLFSKFFYHK